MDLRENILGAAQELYALEGDPGLSMRKVAAECEVTAAMIYYHFKNKQTLYWEIFIDSLNLILKAKGSAVEAVLNYFFF